MIKILVIGINFSPEMIGCSRYTSDLVKYLVDAGEPCEVVTALPHYPGWSVQRPYKAWSYVTESPDGFRISRCPLFLKRNSSGLWRMIAPMTFGVTALPVVLWRALRFRPDVILCVVPTLFVAPAAVLARSLTGARLVFHVQDLEVDAAFAVGHLRNRWLQRLALAFERRMLGAADAVVSISHRMCERLVAKGVSPDRVVMIRNWVDNKVIHPDGNRAAFRNRHGIPQSAFVAMYAGHIGAKQAIEVMLEAARRAEVDRRVMFVIIGDGPKKTSLMASFEELTNVLWLPLQPEHDVCDMLSAADVHVLPQMRSAADLVLPSKLGGMLASGKQIIVAADPGTELSQFLDGAAILVPPGDPDAMAAAVFEARDHLDADERFAARLGLASGLERAILLAEFHHLVARFAAEDAPMGPAAASVG